MPSSDSKPTPSSSPPAASRPTSKCAPATSAPAGTWPRCAVPASTPATPSRPPSTPARNPSATGPARTPSPGTSTPQPTGNRIVADLYQKHSYPYGLIVNLHGQRFVDEGADIRNYTYAKYGREILEQPQRVAFQLFDQRTVALLRDEYRVRQATMATAGSIAELAESLGIDPPSLEDTIAEYNAAIRWDRVEQFNPSTLDGVSTDESVWPMKTNWALPFDSPPYLGYAVTCGITFTFGGLKIDPRSGQVLDTEDRPMPGLYAAGELVGGLFYNNYAGGSGLMAGSVFGRIAGRSAAGGHV